VLGKLQKSAITEKKQLVLHIFVWMNNSNCLN